MPKSPKTSAVELVPAELIERRILLIRGRKVILDRHLADLYEVTTGNLNMHGALIESAKAKG